VQNHGNFHWIGRLLQLRLKLFQHPQTAIVDRTNLDQRSNTHNIRKHPVSESKWLILSATISLLGSIFFNPLLQVRIAAYGSACYQLLQHMPAKPTNTPAQWGNLAIEFEDI